MKCIVIFVMVGKRTYVKGSCGIHIGLRMYSCGILSFSVFAILGFYDCGSLGLLAINLGQEVSNVTQQI